MLRITRQTQRVSLLRQGSAGPRERPADGAAETIRKQGANFAHLGPRGKRRPTWATPQPRKGFQNLVFGGVLSSLSFAAERKGAVGDIKTAALGERIAAAAERSRNDRVFFMSCSAIPGGKVWLPRPMGEEYSRAGRCRHRPLRCIIVGAVELVFPSLLHFSSFCGILGMFHLILKEFSPWKP